MLCASSANDFRKTGERSKNKSAVEGLKEIVLMTRQNITRMELAHHFRETATTIRQGNANNGQIDLPNCPVKRRAGNTTRLDVDPLSVRFDHESERLSH